MNKLNNFFIFIAGFATGTVASWSFFKKKYQRIADAEIASVKESFSKDDMKSSIFEEKDSMDEEQIDANDILTKEEYINYSNFSSNDEKEEKKIIIDRPYVISPDEFGNLDDYFQVSLTFYADSILADDNDDIVDDVEEIVGEESLKHFGEYEDDTVFVRNDAKHCDYEILRDPRTFKSVTGNRIY